MADRPTETYYEHTCGCLLNFYSESVWLEITRLIITDHNHPLYPECRKSSSGKPLSVQLLGNVLLVRGASSVVSAITFLSKKIMWSAYVQAHLSSNRPRCTENSFWHFTDFTPIENEVLVFADDDNDDDGDDDT